MSTFFDLPNIISEAADKAEYACAQQFKVIESIAQYNQEKVLSAFRNARLSDMHFNSSTGYGYSDAGRDVLDAIFAEIVDAEDALVRHSFVSGTHTLAVALFGVLRPGDTLLSVTAKPYDTLDGVIGIRPTAGSLKEFGVNYKQIDFKLGNIDFDGIKNALTGDVKIVFIQRSKGYLQRKTLSCAEIGEIVTFVKAIKNDVLVMVDNCYGEFVEKNEPTSFGADLIVGSLIKNPGGGLARSGGYIAGRKDLIELCAYRMTAPGIGRECGASLDEKRSLFQGLFIAPHVVSQALKTTVFGSAIFRHLGFKATPSDDESLSDIIGTITLGSREAALDFCKGLQSGSPVDSFVTPIGDYMPGYEDDVVMAAGGFIQGSSIELSADAPLREPFTVFFQGGLTYESGKTGMLFAAKNVLKL